MLINCCLPALGQKGVANDRSDKQIGRLCFRTNHDVHNYQSDGKERVMAEWKPFDLKWGREIYACTSCGESVEVPTCMNKPLFKFCPLCGARMKGADDDFCSYGEREGV